MRIGWNAWGEGVDQVQSYAEGGIGGRIRAQRIRRGLTQLQLADLSTVGVRTLRELEAGRTVRPHPVTVRLLTSALGISDDDYAVTAHSLESRADSELADDDVDAQSTLPVTCGDIIGREDDVDLLSNVLLSGQRLITITGFPGSGKTRLAIEVARAVQAAAGTRVVWVGGGQGPDGTTDVGASGRSAPYGHRNAVLKALSGNGTALLVVDGAHWESWPAGVPRPSHPSFQVLTTSRRPLRLPGEITHSVLPLAAPAWMDEDAGAYPAVQLLTQYIRRFQPSFRATELDSAAIAELCRSLDGNPALLLGIADAFSMFEPESIVRYVTTDIASAVAEAAPAVLAGAWEMVATLETDTRELLLQISGLASDWSVGDIAELLGEPPLRVGRRVRGLLDAGLIHPYVTPGTPRFRVLGLVRAMMQGEWAGAPANVSLPGQPRLRIPLSRPASASRTVTTVP
nr:helix-turn-helix domain-containing protein [Saccharothrix sp. ST-888]